MRGVVSALVVAGGFVFAGDMVDALCAARPVPVCEGAGNRFALLTLVRAAIGVPIVGLWWRPRGLAGATRRANAASGALVFAVWTLAAYASFRFDSVFAVEAIRTSRAWVLVAAVAVAAPLLEELVFRGVLLDWSRRWSVWGGVFVTSLGWVLLHWQYEPSTMALLFAMGVVLATARVLTGSLWIPILMHGWWNTVVLIRRRATCLEVINNESDSAELKADR